MSIEQNNSPEINKISQMEQKIHNLEQNIQREYKISIFQLQNLYLFVSQKSRDELREKLIDELKQSGIENVDSSALLDLENKIIEISKLKEQTVLSINALKEDLIKLGVEEIKKLSSELFFKYPPNILKIITNPENVFEESLAFLVGVLESGVVVGKLAVDLTKGIIYTPVDLYKIASGKATYTRDDL